MGSSSTGQYLIISCFGYPVSIEVDFLNVDMPHSGRLLILLLVVVLHTIVISTIVSLLRS